MEKIKDLIEKIFDEENQIYPFKRKYISLSENNNEIDVKIDLGFVFKRLEEKYKKIIFKTLEPTKKSVKLTSN